MMDSARLMGGREHMDHDRGWAESFSRWRILIPGLDQWAWRQHERSLVLFGSYVSALVVGVFAWGTKAGWAILAFAVGTHLVSVTDVIRQAAFPGFGRWVPWVSATVGVGLGGYAPTLVAALVLAWPALEGSNGFAVNRLAYWGRAPEPGDWVWLVDEPERRVDPVAPVLATAGSLVEWSEDQLLVDGRRAPGAPTVAPDRPGRLKFEVPEGFLLITRRALDKHGKAHQAGDDPHPGLELVTSRSVHGRAWAQLYPVWSRRLLP